MHGKAKREPARHSVVLDCKLVPLPVPNNVLNSARSDLIQIRSFSAKL